jgi:hypothetical protein
MRKISGIDCHIEGVNAVNIEDVKPHPRNHNAHPDTQIALLAKNIKALGWRWPILVSNRSGFIVAGHARREAAALLNVAQVPVSYQDFETEEQETIFRIADNRIAELAEIQMGQIKDLLQELDDGATDMDLTGFDAEELERLMNQFHVIENDGDGKSGSSPWDQVGDAADGVMFSFGAVQKRMPVHLYESFCSKVDKENVEEWIDENIRD